MLAACGKQGTCGLGCTREWTNAGPGARWGRIVGSDPMTELARFVGDFGCVIGVRPVGIDEFSSVRYVHAAAMRISGGHTLSDSEILAFTGYVYSPAYAETLGRLRLFGAYIGNELVGTAGWSVADDSGGSVRVRSVFVRPLFTGVGIGRRLVGDVEGDARAAGFGVFSVRATMNATGFFERLGYQTTSHGVRPLGSEHVLPVAFMRKCDPSAGDDRNDGRDG